MAADCLARGNSELKATANSMVRSSSATARAVCKTCLCRRRRSQASDCALICLADDETGFRASLEAAFIEAAPPSFGEYQHENPD